MCYDCLIPDASSYTGCRLQIEDAKRFAPNLNFVDTSNDPDSKCDGLKPDIAVYAPGVDTVPKTDFSKMELWLEFKVDESADGFEDPIDPLNPNASGHQFERETDHSMLTRGQLASYAAAHMGAQFRTHSFSLLVCGKFVRFLRWDRSGAAVSRRCNYAQQPEILVDFLRRFSHLDSKGRGSDTSVSPPTSNDIKLARDALAIDDTERTFLKLLVPGDPGVPDVHYIVPCPTYTSRSPFGRATRPSRAYNLDTDAVVFFKDYWRINGAGMKKEGDIYRLLHQHKVPHIAPFDRGNDVLDHSTLGHTLRNERWACRTKELPCHQHYRMGLNVVGRDVVEFNSSWEFVSAIADGMEGTNLLE
jgi:hypothetical protein